MDKNIWKFEVSVGCKLRMHMEESLRKLMSNLLNNGLWMEILNNGEEMLKVSPVAILCNKSDRSPSRNGLYIPYYKRAVQVRKNLYFTVQTFSVRSWKCFQLNHLYRVKRSGSISGSFMSSIFQLFFEFFSQRILIIVLDYILMLFRFIWCYSCSL